MYSCSKCGLGVIVQIDGVVLEKPIKACECNATIVADMSTTIKGRSGMNTSGVAELTKHRENN